MDDRWQTEQFYGLYPFAVQTVSAYRFLWFEEKEVL